MSAVSLDIGGGGGGRGRVSALSNRQNCTCARKTLQTQQERTDAQHRYMRQWFRTAEPLGERRYENWNTHTQCMSIYMISNALLK